MINDDPSTQDLVWATLVSLLGVPAEPRWGAHLLDELRQDNKITPVTGIGCTPSVIQATREEVLERIGRARAGGSIPFPEANGPVVWPSFEMSDLLMTPA